MQFHTLQSLQLWARIALPAEHPDRTTGSHYLLSHQSTTSFKKSLLLPPLQCLELLHLPNGRTIEHWSYRTSIASNIDHIEHRLHWTSIESNIDWTEPDRTNPTVRTRPPSNTKPIEHRTSKIEHQKPNIENWTSKIEHQKSNIESWISKIEYQISIKPSIRTRPTSYN